MRASCLIWLAAVSTASSMSGHGSQASNSQLDIPVEVNRDRRLIEATDLIQLREIGGMLGNGLSVSPDGEYVAFEMHQADVAANDYRVEWFVAATSRNDTAVNVDDGGDPILFRHRQPGGRVVGAWITEYAKWSPDSRGIAYRKKSDGETQIWWSARDGLQTKQLSHSSADVEEFHWSSDGSRIFFATDADRSQLREAERLRYRNGHVYDHFMDWSTIDAKPYYSPYLLTGGKPRIWVLDIATQQERQATDDEYAEFDRLRNANEVLAEAPEARRIVFTEDDRRAAWVQPDDPDRQGESPPLTVYASVPGRDAQTFRCSADECTGVMELSRFLRDGLHWESTGDEVYFIRKEGPGYSRRSIYGWNVESDSVRKILTTNEWISDCSIVRGRAICFRETAVYPRTIIAIDMSNGNIETLVDLNPEFRNVMLGDVEFLEWTNELGYGTFGYLVKPPDYVPGRRYPLVFVGYRARHALRGGVGDEYPVHLLAANSFIVLVYDKPYPYEANEIYNDPLDIGKSRWGPDLFDVRMPLASLESAIRLLDDRGLIDPARVAITGLSAGVSDVNYALINSNSFKAAIASSCEWAPSAYFLTGVSSDSLRRYREAIGAGAPGSPSGHLRKHVSLALNADRITTPLLVNAASDEHPWALEEIVTLLDHNKPVELVVHPDEGHVKWHPAHRFAIYERNVDWLNFWLRNVVDSSSAKVDQYARWHRLRDARSAN